jgi:hypothetical protein
MLRVAHFNQAELSAVHSTNAYEVQLRKNKRGVNLIFDALPFGGLW